MEISMDRTTGALFWALRTCQSHPTLQIGELLTRHCQAAMLRGKLYI